MEIAYQVMAWRRQKGLTQDALARRAHLTRPYLSRLENGRVDPALSTLRHIAMALDVPLGELVDQAPDERKLGREDLDQLARAALWPGTQAAQNVPGSRALTRLIKERRRSLGLYSERTKRGSHPIDNPGKHAARWLRASLGEEQWRALLQRIDKLASLYAGSR